MVRYKVEYKRAGLLCPWVLAGTFSRYLHVREQITNLRAQDPTCEYRVTALRVTSP